MAILSSLPAVPPRPHLNPRTFYYIALAASVVCFWTIFHWSQGLYEQIQTLTHERDAALSTARGREVEQKAQMEELQRLKKKYGFELDEASALIKELNATGQATGYKHYPSGQLEGTEEIVVAIKTGATELFKTLPIHFVTTLPQTANYLLFSDHEQTIGQYQIQDSLNETTEEARKTYNDFQLYRDQRQYMAEGQNPEFLDFKGGWELDKFKNIPILAKTWRQRPNAKWYVFIDADTYIGMANLMPFLKTLDHKKELYFGSPTYIADLEFAHGGTGYVLSHAAVKKVMEKHPRIDGEYDAWTKEQCCGDYAVARALKDNDISLKWASPNFNGEPPYMIEFDKDKMCQPLITLHHMRAQDVGDYWNFEREHAKPGQYILFADAYEYFVAPHLRDERLDWDNLGGNQGELIDIEKDWEEAKNNGTKVPSHFDRCKASCRGKDDCVQWRTHKEECRISTHTQLGWKVPVSYDDNETYKSGWFMDRVNDLRTALPCKQPEKDWAKKRLQPD